MVKKNQKWIDMVISLRIIFLCILIDQLIGIFIYFFFDPYIYIFAYDLYGK